MRTALVLALACVSAIAEIKKDEDPFFVPEMKTEEKAPPDYTGERWWEIGVGIGHPAGLNLNFGYWWRPRFPGLLRLSGMVFGTGDYGALFELGWPLAMEDELKHYVSLGVSTRGIDEPPVYSQFTGAGPIYGVNWHGIALQAGVLVGGGRYRDVGQPEQAFAPVRLTIQAGYSLLL